MKMLNTIEEYGKVTFEVLKASKRYTDPCIVEAKITDVAGENKELLNTHQMLRVYSLIMLKGYIAEANIVLKQDSLKRFYTLQTVGDVNILNISKEKIIENYLEKNIKGIGKVKASKIVGQYGLDSIEKIMNNKDILLNAGLSAENAAKERNYLIKKIELSEIYEYVAQTGIPPVFVPQLYHVLGEKAFEIIRTAPEKLYDSRKIYFINADIIAKNKGLVANSPKRIQGAIIDFLFLECKYKRTKSLASTYVVNNLVKHLNFKKSYSPEQNKTIHKKQIREAIKILKTENRIIEDVDKDGKKHLYLPELFNAKVSS